MKKHADVVVVGQGIAGTCLAVELIEKGQNVLVIDDGHTHSSSMIAAGMINPIVFKRLTKGWNVDLLMPAMYSFFGRMEEKLETSLVNPIEILKLFTSIQEQNQWLEKSDALGFEEHLGDALSQKEVEALYELKAPFGGGVIKTSSYIDLPKFLNQTRDYFISQDSFLKHAFDFDELSLTEKKYQDITFDKIVFCEGHMGTKNPIFKDLPFNLTKGEMIEFKQDSLSLDRIVNKNGFVLPTKQNTFKLGATYEWKELDQVTTEKGKETLLDRLTFLKNEGVEVVDHVAGIRPTVKDRRPLFGKHDIEEAYIFNGLGTKGALMAPYYAKQMCNFIVEGINLDSEVDIKRFRKAQ
jgi:glycine oxidase